MYKVLFAKQAEKSLRKIPKDYQMLVKKTVSRLEQNPFSLDLKKLGARYLATHRLRVGSYRLFLHIDTKTKTIIIADIVRRTSKTY